MGTYRIILAFGVVALLAAGYVHCAKIHEQMTDEEIADFFHTSRDNIPEYEVVSIRHNLHKRSDPTLQLQFNAFGRQIDAYLEPDDGQLAGENTPVWLAFTKPDGKIEYKKLREDIVGLVVGFYNSPLDLSSVVVHDAEGKDTPSFQGTVDGMAIRPVPARLQGSKRLRRKINALNANSPMQETHYHVIIKSPSMKEEQKLRQLERQMREARQSANKNNATRAKRSSQEVIYPSLLIRTDFKGSKTTQNDLAYYDEIMYQLAFWNGVDLRYRHVDDPKIRLRIAGIIIGQDRAATPYLNKNRNNDVIDMNKGWDDMELFWDETSKLSDFRPEAYDAVITMTNYDMSVLKDDGSRKYILGRAAKRSLCMFGGYMSYYAIGVVQDKGGFAGVLTATHELGHILGLDHDEATGDECDKSLGYIMAPSDAIAAKNLEWSPCSLRSLSHFLRDIERFCADEPADFHDPGLVVPRFLPGDIADAHKQCQGRGYHWACDPFPEMCTNMNCYVTGWAVFKRGFWCKSAGPAAEGTVCAPDHKCVDGVCQCVSKDCIFKKTQKPV